MDQQPPQRRLSEISHLFLSDVRAKQTGNAPRPVRKPPGSFTGDVSIDLTPEEFAHVFDDEKSNAPRISFKPVRAVIAHHVGETMGEQVRNLAGMFCTDGARIGVIYADAGDVRVCCIEHNPNQGPVAGNFPTEPLEPQRVEQAIVELNHDVDEWMIVLPDTHCQESRAILRSIPNWILITGTDHDSVVESYRTLKGLVNGHVPSVSVAVYGANDDDEVRKTFQKLSSVFEQFLKLKTELFGAIEADDQLAEHVVLEASSSFNKATLAAAPQWQVLKNLIAGATPATAKLKRTSAMPKPAMARPTMTIASEIPAAPAFIRADMPEVTAIESTVKLDDTAETIIDLPDANSTPTALIQAIIRGTNELVETPIKAPINSDVVISVSRDHRLVMLAVASHGMTEMRSIAQAYRWMNENRTLIAMALPQFSLDVHALPRLELLVNHADMTADVLQPLLASGNVLVRAYRKLRWGAKTGLLLEAA